MAFPLKVPGAHFLAAEVMTTSSIQSRESSSQEPPKPQCRTDLTQLWGR